VVDIMRVNVEKVLERDQKISELDKRAGETISSGNAEQGKCRLTNEYPFFLFLLGRWYNEKNICIYKNDLF